MRIDDRFLDEIKSRLRLSDVIGRTVKLRRQGREYVGLSPFNKEKSPSFFVNDDKGFYHDFSSGKHGDLISFLQETERLTFMEAVERLAAEAGVPMPVQDERAAEKARERADLSDWLEQAGKWFEAELRRPVGAEARAYLLKRGLPESEWARFRLGFAPGGRTALKDFLIAKGARPQELVEAGLLIAPDEGGAPYDRFRERIIFPIGDARGRIVSFGGRAMDPQARAKYLNGPETALFHKGATLYGLAEARKLLAAAEPGAPLVVVEGYMDAIACQRAGIASVAPLGTALTEEQMEALWRLHPEPTLCFDGDNAGQRAASRAMDRALPLLKAGRSFRFSMVSGGKDPDDVLREQGAVALKTQLAQTEPFVHRLFVRERDLEPLDTPERKAGLKARLRAAAQAIQDPDLSAAYRDDLFQRLDEAVGAPTRGERRVGRPGGGKSPQRWRDPRRPAYEDAPLTAEGKAAGQRLKRAIDPVAAAVASGALADPARLEPHLETLEQQGFGDPGLKALAGEIIRVRLDADVLDRDVLARHLASGGFGALLGEIDKAAALSGAPFLNPDILPTVARSQWSQAFEALTRMSALDDAIQAAKSDLDGRSGMEAIERMKAERDALKRAIGSGTVWATGES
ncbi:DNA primase [Phenylobacterium montanum]|uniref:DNA primase n=1 Tax=Phenylobacterium montanum TaxID=2823693 RepID=A0A975G3J1_9CAUL|nr:DNA primase [Caulobacter sp. S6]QUD89917.1 DNA primase [Caulobacter sp. S6]